MSNLSISAQIELRQKQNELMTLSNKENLTASEKRKFDALLAEISLIKSGQISDEIRFAESDRLAKEFSLGSVDRSADGKARAEERAALRKLLVGPSGNYELRTYSALSDTSTIVAQTFVDRVALTMKSAGPLYAGSPAVTNVKVTGEGLVAKLPVIDDLQAGYVVGESVAETDSNPTASNITLTLQKFSSGIIQYSMELSQDVAEFDAFSAILARSLGARLSRIQNQTFLATLLTALEANSSASISSITSGAIEQADLVSLVSAVNAAYRQNASFLMSTDTAKKIGSIVDSQNRPIHRHVLSEKPSLLGYDVFISDYVDSVATGNHPLFFGDLSTLYCRATDGFGVQVFHERFIDVGSYAILMRKRADMEYSIPSTSDSAIKMLTIS